MLRSLARTALNETVSRLPGGVRRAFFEALAGGDGSFQYELFRAMGRSLGVETVGVRGECGLVEGALDDAVMIGTYARTRTWSPVKTGYLERFFDGYSGGTYLDIGANIGLTTLPVARNPAVFCKAFEPEPRSFRYLARNVAANCGSHNVELFNVALFDRQAMLEFELSEANLADHRIRVAQSTGKFGEHKRPAIQVRAERLDDYLDAETLVRPLAAKIVAQGSEAHVISGGAALLGQAETLVIQFYPYQLARAGGDVAFLANFLASHFSSGSIVLADEVQSPEWWPSPAIAEQVGALMTRFQKAPFEYFHILARK
jgi:FkbM family methyltransferase